MKKWDKIFVIPAVLLSVVSLANVLFAGQANERVAFYARTFGGTVFVTKSGEIVYSLTVGSSELRVQSEELGSKKSEVRRQKQAVGQSVRRFGKAYDSSLKSGAGGVTERAETQPMVSQAFLPDIMMTSGDAYLTKEESLQSFPSNKRGLRGVSESTETQPPESPFIKGEHRGNSPLLGDKGKLSFSNDNRKYHLFKDDGNFHATQNNENPPLATYKENSPLESLHLDKNWLDKTKYFISI